MPDEDQSVAEEEPHRLQIDRRARHELASLLVIEERKLEPLKVSVEAVAQVELDAERHLSGDQPAQHAQYESSEPGHPNGDGPHDQLPVVVVADRVDREAREVRDQHGEPDRPERERKRPRDTPPIGMQETKQASERQHTS